MGGDRDKDRGKGPRTSGPSSGSRTRSRSPVRNDSADQNPPAGSSNASPPNENLTRADFMSMMSEAMHAQFPKLILETTKVVTAQLQSENHDASRSFTSYSQDLKQLKLRTEEVEAKAKTAALKSEGGYSMINIKYLIHFPSHPALTFHFRSH